MRENDAVSASIGTSAGAKRNKRVYCTYFDINYLPKGLALWRSLQSVSPDAVLWVCCFDPEALSTMERLALPGIFAFPIEDVERHFPELLRVKSSRSRVEYFFTCTPSVLRYLFDRLPDLTQLTYLDADLYFFADPEPLFDELERADGAVGIIEHRFPERLKHCESHGVYNVGWITFLRDRRGLACLDDWRLKCVEWCYDREEDGRYADQKYLDQWPARFDGVVVLRHAGANVALWNLERWRIDERSGTVTVDDEPLLFYHFHGVSAVTPWLFHTFAAAYSLRLGPVVRRLIYMPYLRVWRDVMTDLPPRPRTSSGRTGAPINALDFVRGFVRSPKDAFTVAWGIVRRHGEYLFVLRPRRLWRIGQPD